MTTTARVKVAVTAAGFTSFALLYAPQAVLPQLAEQYHLDPGGASLSVSVATGALAISVLPIAALSEVVGRRSVILTSVIVSAVLGLLLPVIPSYSLMLVVRAVQGVAIAGFPGVATAYLVERLGKVGVGAAVGAMIAGNSLGGMTGRLATGFTAAPFGWRGALYVVAGISLVCAVITVVTLPPSRRAKDAPRQQLRDVCTGVLHAVRKPVLLAQYTVALLAMGSFVALYNAAGFRLTGELHLSEAIASLVFLAYALGSVSSALASRLTARVGRRRAMIGALVLMAVGSAVTIPGSVLLFALGFVILTCSFFAVHAIANGWAAAEAPENARGQTGGIYMLLYYLGSSIGGAVGAVIYGAAGWAWLIVAVAAWLVLAVVAVAVGTSVRRTRERGREPVPT